MDQFGYVLASKMLVEGRRKVRFMYREQASGDDSGWRFFCGEEDQAYTDDPGNIAIYSIDTILEIDKSVTPYLNAVVGMAFERQNENGAFVMATDYGFAPEEGS